MNIRSKHELARDIVIARGGTPKPLDTFHNFLEKWLVQEGGTPKPGDSQNDLLRKICVARGLTPHPIDGNNDLLRHMSGLGVGCMNTEHLKAILALIEAGEDSVPEPEPPVLTLWMSDGISDQSFLIEDTVSDETAYELWGRDVTVAQAFTLQETALPNLGAITGHLHVTGGMPGFLNNHDYEYYIRAVRPSGNLDSTVLAFSWAIA